jgi:hypothetical protein
MAVTVKKAIRWRREVDNSPGMLPVSSSHFPKHAPTCKWLWPIATRARRTRPPLRCVRFLVGSPQRPRKQRVTPPRPSPLVVEGDNRPGLGHAIAKAIGDAGINISFVMAQVVGRRYSAVFGLENELTQARPRP